MPILQKNIWMIFYILVTCGLLLFGIAAQTKWETIHKQYATEQTNLVKLVTNASHSVFLMQEMMLNILGNQIAKDNDPRILDDLLELNPSIIAFGFVDVNGTYIHVNSKFDKAKMPNLRQQAVSKDSFDYTLMQDKMVLGRTYFVGASGRWGIPVRKAVHDASGTLIGVMTAGLGIEGAFKIFADNLSQGAYNKVTLMRDRDHFVQFQSSTKEIPKELYASPLPDRFFSDTIEAIQQMYRVSFETIKQGKDVYVVEVDNHEGKRVQLAIKYDSRYELWVFSEIDHQKFFEEFVESIGSYGFIFIIVHIVLFFLFQFIANAEAKRRSDLMHRATHDVLTQLPNRSYLQQNIGEWIHKDARSFNLCYLDMDHFKNVNDDFGHEFGDMLLVEFSKRVVKLVKGDDIIVRQGGDEFIILTHHADEKEVVEYAQSLLAVIAQPYRLKQHSFTVSASIGIAKYPEHGTTLDMLLHASDIAMYEAKKYKNSVRMFVPEMEDGYLSRMNHEVM